MLCKLSSAVDLRCRLLRCLFHFSSTSSSSSSLTCDSPSPSPLHFMAEYLITLCGFSPSEAAMVARSLSHLKTPEKPNSVVEFLELRGFDKTQLRKLIFRKPKLLCSNVEKTIAPKFQALEELGFSGSDIAIMLTRNPDVLHRNLNRTFLPGIQLWSQLLGPDRLTKVLKYRAWFFRYSIEKTVAPNLSFLRECGISDKIITSLLRRNPAFILRRPERLRDLVERVKKLGISQNTPEFPLAMWSLRFVSKSKFKAKLEAMRSFGWSEVHFLAAFRKLPTFLTISEKALLAKMEFFIKEVGCEPYYLGLHPGLFTYSIEKRVMPRHRVVTMLKERGLHIKGYKISTILVLSDEMFVTKFIHPYKEELPWLEELYATECGRRGGT